MKTKLYHLCILASVSFAAYSQDAFFLSSNQNLINLNPSFAGSNGGIRNQLVYQREALYYSRYTTIGDNFDAYIKPLKAGIAVSYLCDNIANGELKTTGLGFTYAQHFTCLNKQLKIIPSLQANYVQKSLDTQHGLTYGDLIDPRLGSVWGSGITPSASKSYASFSMGLLVNYKNLYAGISVFNLNQPYAGMDGITRQAARVSANVSYNLHVSEQVLVNIAAQFAHQDLFNAGQLTASVLLGNHLIVGASYINGGFSSSKTDHPYEGYYFNRVGFYNAGGFSCGYRSNFVTVTAFYNGSILTPGGSNYGGTLSYTLRNKELRNKITNIEAW